MSSGPLVVRACTSPPTPRSETGPLCAVSVIRPVTSRTPIGPLSVSSFKSDRRGANTTKLTPHDSPRPASGPSALRVVPHVLRRRLRLDAGVHLDAVAIPPLDRDGAVLPRIDGDGPGLREPDDTDLAMLHAPPVIVVAALR